MITGRAKIAGVMGWPVAHSLSPRLHNFWLQTFHIDGTYIPLPVQTEDVAGAFKLLPRLRFRGWNVTVPHKELALELVDEADDAARAIGAVNTVVVLESGRLLGSNTDAIGFMRNVKRQVPDLSPYKRKVVLFGAGGAARAVCKALADEGFDHVVIVNRTWRRGEELAQQFTHCKPVAWENKNKELEDASFIINTTTLGMVGNPPLDVDSLTLDASALVTDIVYRPLETPLIASARARGCTVVTGIGMLIEQAVPGFEAWYGMTPKVTADLEDMLLA